jgi:hypothetical protein
MIAAGWGTGQRPAYLRYRRMIARTAVLIALATPALLAVARADTVEGDNVRISFEGQIRPAALPRAEPAPVALRVAGTVRPLNAQRPAALERLTIQVNRHAIFTTRGLPSCPMRRLLGTSTRQALDSCGEALLGYGSVNSHIDIPDQAPFPASGRLLAFKTTERGRPAIAIHVFGRSPAPIATVLSATYSRSGPATGSFGPELSVEMPKIGDDWGYVTGFNLVLHRRYRFRGRAMSVVRASCPAPADLRTVPFKAARGIFELADGQTLTRTLSGTCKATN